MNLSKQELNVILQKSILDEFNRCNLDILTAAENGYTDIEWNAESNHMTHLIFSKLESETDLDVTLDEDDKDSIIYISWKECL
jgi:hypothetical protein